MNKMNFNHVLLSSGDIQNYLHSVPNIVEKKIPPYKNFLDKRKKS